jgi:preprotein translocase subunit SecA
VAVTAEKQPLARIARQRYFGIYQQLCGMTGTAAGHEQEFYDCYALPVVLIPLRRPCQRSILPTRYFLTAEEKWAAIVADITTRFHCGQPVLVGTRTIEESQLLAARLRKARIPHNVLNGKQDKAEAQIVSEAGRKSTVTIATNMAGRGTDIQVDEQVCQLGGLHVIATQRQESRRVDRQLIGRTARQGQPGSCQFFVSADDQIIVQYGGTLRGSAHRAIAAGDTHALDRLLDRIQRRAEHHKYQQRRQLYHEDAWLNELLTSMGEKDREAEHRCQTLNPGIT